MKRTRLVFLLLDQSAVDAFFNDQIDIATLGQDYGALKLLTPVFTYVPPEEDSAAFQVVAEGSDPAYKDAEFHRRYFICYDTTKSAPLQTINALIDKIKHVGHDFTYINTCNRDMRALWNYLPKPNNQQQESAVEQPKKLHPKTVNLILSGINQATVTHDGRLPIAGLLDEMIARGGKIFAMRQKDQSEKENREVAQSLIDHVNDPLRHPDTDYIVFTTNAVPVMGSEISMFLKETTQLLKDRIEDSHLNVFTFDHRQPVGHVLEILYQTVYMTLSPQGFPDPIMRGPFIKPEVLEHLRLQVQHAQQTLQAIGFGLTVAGVPGQGANFQAFGRSGRPFPGQPGWQFQQHGHPDVYPFQPVAPAGFGSEMHGFAPPRAFSPFKPLFDFSGNVVIHYVGTGQEQEAQAKQVSDFVGKQMPNATIIPVDYDDTLDLKIVDQKVGENVAWRGPQANIHLVMMVGRDGRNMPSVDVIAQEIFRSVAARNPHVDTVYPGEVVTGPVMLHKLLALVVGTPQAYQSFRPSGQQRFGAVRPAAGYRAQPQLSMPDLMVELDKFDGVVVFHSVGIDASIAVEDAWKNSIHPTMTAADFKHYNYSFADDGAVFDKVKANVGQATDQKQLHVVVSDARFAVTNQTASARMGYEIHATIARHGNFAVGLSTPEELRIDSQILDNLYHLTLVQQHRNNQKY